MFTLQPFVAVMFVDEDIVWEVISLYAQIVGCRGLDRKAHSFGFLAAQNYLAQKRSSASVNSGGVVVERLDRQPLQLSGILRQIAA